ncbi:restriction endonuclease subunit S [Vibrio cholerae]|nr:restriction endonuclease subunit S [Vibrio cholerae]
MTGRYKAYPEYKDSGLRWLPELPSNWKVERTKRMFALKRSLVGNQSSDYQLLSLTLKGVVPRDISSGEGKIPESFDTYQKVDENDLIFCLFDMDETPRTIGISPLNGMITGAYNVYGCLESCCANYAYYYFLHIDSFKGLKPFYTGLRKVVRAETFGNIEMPCPSFEEQQKIASFLDHETAKIDTLIAKQEMLIELLKEKRQAVISHAVTKGLNPNAPMKDSGVEWLGEVPEHWVVSSIKYLSSFVGTGGTPKNQSSFVDDNDAIKWFAPGDFSDKIELTQSSKYISFEAVASGDAKLYKENSVLVIGIGATLGKVALCKDEFSCNQQINMITPNKKTIAEFITFSLSAQHEQMKQLSNASTIGIMNQEKTKSIQIAQPPLAEQIEIVKYLNIALERFKLLESKATKQVDLLKERKTALISAAVTGKIDVRDWEFQGVEG